MSECNHMPPKKYHCVQCLLDEIADLREQLADSDIVFGHGWREAVETVLGQRVFNAEQHQTTQAATIQDLRDKLTHELSVRQMTVQRIKGKVDGHPTHQGNFLQRIDQLTLIEARVLMHSAFSSDPNMVAFTKQILNEEADDAIS